MKKICILALVALTIILGAWSWYPDRHHKPRPRPTPTATKIPTVIPTTTPGYLLDDEFNSLNTNIWYNCSSPCYPPNNEMQVYRSSNVSVHDGMLDLVATKSGSSYSSGKVMTWQKFSFLYGHIEARVLIPYGQGLWPAFWLLHDANEDNSNEIDIMESVNNEHVDYFSDHYNLNGQFLHATSEAPITDGWHVLALDWQKDKLVWSIDGVAKFSITDPNKIPGTQMNIILNLAVGGDWPGSPDSSSVFPAHFLIDYVRISK
jgi:beta-glucanase (GH16 family)